jgi:hypothetical protein
MSLGAVIMTPSTAVSTNALGLLQFATSFTLIGRHVIKQQINVERRLFRPVDAASAAEGLDEFALVHKPPNALDEFIGVLIAGGLNGAAIEQHDAALDGLVPNEALIIDQHWLPTTQSPRQSLHRSRAGSSATNEDQQPDVLVNVEPGDVIEVFDLDIIWKFQPLFELLLADDERAPAAGLHPTAQDVASHVLTMQLFIETYSRTLAPSGLA